MKVVINHKHGGFGLSDEAVHRYAHLKGMHLVKERKHGMTHYYKDSISKETYFAPYEISRDDPVLVQVVEELGDKANSHYAHLVIVDIPDDVSWHIAEYDGYEHVAENHRTWG